MAEQETKNPHAHRPDRRASEDREAWAQRRASWGATLGQSTYGDEGATVDLYLESQPLRTQWWRMCGMPTVSGRVRTDRPHLQAMAPRL